MALNTIEYVDENNKSKLVLLVSNYVFCILSSKNQRSFTIESTSPSEVENSFYINLYKKCTLERIPNID